MQALRHNKAAIHEGEAPRAAVRGVTKSQTRFSDSAVTATTGYIYLHFFPAFFAARELVWDFRYNLCRNRILQTKVCREEHGVSSVKYSHGIDDGVESPGMTSLALLSLKSYLFSLIPSLERVHVFSFLGLLLYTTPTGGPSFTVFLTTGIWVHG